MCVVFVYFTEYINGEPRNTTFQVPTDCLHCIWNCAGLLPNFTRFRLVVSEVKQAGQQTCPLHIRIMSCVQRTRRGANGQYLTVWIVSVQTCVWVGVATTLRAGRSGRGKISVIRNVQTVSGLHPASYSMDT